MIRKGDFAELLENLLTVGHWVFLRPFPVAGHIATANQFTVIILKFIIEDFTDLGLLKIRRTLTGLSLWFCLTSVHCRMTPKYFSEIYVFTCQARVLGVRILNCLIRIQIGFNSYDWPLFPHLTTTAICSQAFLGIKMAPGETTGRQYFLVLFKRGLWFVNIIFKNGGVWLIHRAVLAIVSES